MKHKVEGPTSIQLGVTEGEKRTGKALFIERYIKETEGTNKIIVH